MATIHIIYDPAHTPTAPQQLDIAEAALQWGAVLQNVLNIYVKVLAVPLPGAHNAMCVPGVVQHGGQTLTRAQAKLLGVPIVDAAVPALDMVILINSGTAWITGFAPAPVVGPAQYSLLTTIMHEMCHGLGVLGLCNVNSVAATGAYSDTALIGLLPPGVAPASFFPAGLQNGYGWRTPFAALFAYQGVLALLTKGNAADDYVAFMSAPGPVVVPVAAGNYTLLTAGGHFIPFTTCDHIQGADPLTHVPFLMSSSTAGLFMATPDASSRDILRALGWNC